MGFMEDISQALLLCFDNLKDDPNEDSQEAIRLIDEAEGDAQIKQGLEMAIPRLRALGKLNEANIVENLTKGF